LLKGFGNRIANKPYFAWLERSYEMFQKKIIIKNKTGLHARPASELMEFCAKFESEIILTTEAHIYG
jgi:hypothetical protein